MMKRNRSLDIDWRLQFFCHGSCITPHLRHRGTPALLPADISKTRNQSLLKTSVSLVYIVASMQIQAFWRGWKQLQYCKMYGLLPNDDITNAVNNHTLIKENRSAFQIQQLWKKKACMRVYIILRDLINFHRKGDPKQLLRAINPSEIELFDACTNIHIRFRLGGSVFPPTLYYKIYSSGAICDIGAFAPRNYSNGAVLHRKERGNGQRGLKVNGYIMVGKKRFQAEAIMGNDGMDEWYQRDENNGWRAVTGPQTEIMSQIKLSWEIMTKTRWRPKKTDGFVPVDIGPINPNDGGKLRSTTKMYRNVLGKTREVEKSRKCVAQHEHCPAKYPIDGYTKVVLKNECPNATSMEQYDDVLNWANSLDFDLYLRQWSTIGTSCTTGTCATNA
mmetsp:Transcript_1285/g.1871  ORF Transcript_1285/g.1871 Transcript_1285/m.1871 type:complete len:389 (-) Transcript_1285:268-1434(-)